jgi:small subunit ribosomal protein S16
MLTIRLQRGGRKGHPQYRVIAQDSRFSPTSGRYAALLGTYDPHSKAVTINKEKVAMYLGNGAQPSERAARLLSEQGVALPSWVKLPDQKSRAIKQNDKLRRNRPAEPEAPAEAAPVETEGATDAEPAAETETEAETQAEA